MITPNAGEDVEKLTHSGLVGMLTITATGKGILVVLMKVNMLLPHNPAIAFLGTYPREIGTFIHSQT